MLRRHTQIKQNAKAREGIDDVQADCRLGDAVRVSV